MQNSPENPLLRGSRDPDGQVDTAQGKIYLYTSTLSGLLEVEKLGPTATPEARGRKILQGVASLADRSSKQQVPKLPTDVMEKLSEEELGAIVEAYRKVIEEEHESDASKHDREPVEPRRADEPALVFLDRLFHHHWSAATAGLREGWPGKLTTSFPSMGNLIRDLRSSSDRLGATLAQARPISIEPASPAWAKDLEASQERIAQERREDRDRALLASQTAVQSADLLQKLVETAGVFMAKMDERDLKNDTQIRLQLRITVWSVVISAVLSLVAAVYAVRSFEQDKEKNAGDDAVAKATAERERRLVGVLEENAAVIRQNAQVIERLNSRQAPPSAVQGRKGTKKAE